MALLGRSEGCFKMDLQFDKTEHEDMPHFTIKGTLPSLNEYLSACRKHPQAGAKLKRDCEMIVCNAIRRGVGRYHTDKPIILHYHIYEPTMKRDRDNVVSAVMKYTQDALQKCGVIDNDGWKNILNFTHDFFIDKGNARIEVYIEEVSNNGMG